MVPTPVSFVAAAAVATLLAGGPATPAPAAPALAPASVPALEVAAVRLPAGPKLRLAVRTGTEGTAVRVIALGRPAGIAVRIHAGTVGTVAFDAGGERRTVTLVVPAGRADAATIELAGPAGVSAVLRPRSAGALLTLRLPAGARDPELLLNAERSTGLLALPCSAVALHAALTAGTQVTQASATVAEEQLRHAAVCLSLPRGASGARLQQTPFLALAGDGPGTVAFLSISTDGVTRATSRRVSIDGHAATVTGGTDGFYEASVPAGALGPGRSHRVSVRLCRGERCARYDGPVVLADRYAGR